ncbi:hypothetical protein [Lysobacter sp. Root690]|uniref:hypothetical protein n=1 Tax=Lysobacter sp. Root690 TaxID=1736588 RepID=UPI0006FEBB05|nr:hypothetical protein [Lysobacter sp. Root690]KRB06717.1 hypothetical protein ASD86_11915 [Lysobacter sp. Root690]
MKRILFAAMRVVGGLCLQMVGLLCAFQVLTLGGEFDQVEFGFVLLFFVIVSLAGVIGGVIGRLYVLPPTLLLFWLVWAAFISLDQWPEIKLGEETYMDGVVERLLQIVISSAALVGGIFAGERWARRLWPASRVEAKLE